MAAASRFDHFPATAHQGAALLLLRPPPSLLLPVGPAGSGKSTMCRALAARAASWDTRGRVPASCGSRGTDRTDCDRRRLHSAVHSRGRPWRMRHATQAHRRRLCRWYARLPYGAVDLTPAP
mgnify:CR=1 FL=1